MQLPRVVRPLFTTAIFLLALVGASLDGTCFAADKADPKDRIKVLLKERVSTAKEIYELLLEKYKAGAGNIGSVHRAKVAWMNARLSIAETRAERLKIYEEILTEAKDWEQSAIRNLENGAGLQIEVLTARAERIEAEIALEQEKAEPVPEKIPAPKN
jgi:outer membrane protein TolC